MLLRWPFKIARRLASLVVTAAVIYFIISGVQVVLGSRVPEATRALEPAATIIVLGSSVDQNSPSADLVNRLEAGLKCFQAHLAPTFTVTGTDATGQANVASVEAGWLEVNGVPKSDIHVISGSSTASQIQAAASHIGAGQRVIIVTDAMKAFWTRGTAVHYGLHPQIAPALDSERPFYEQIGTVLSQAGAVAFGRVFGFQTATWA